MGVGPFIDPTRSGVCPHQSLQLGGRPPVGNAPWHSACHLQMGTYRRNMNEEEYTLRTLNPVNPTKNGTGQSRSKPGRPDFSTRRTATSLHGLMGLIVASFLGTPPQRMHLGSPSHSLCQGSPSSPNQYPHTQLGFNHHFHPIINTCLGFQAIYGEARSPSPPGGRNNFSCCSFHR